MKYIFTAAALLAATVIADKRDLCSEGSTDDDGNYYCQEVDAITYTSVGSSGSYDIVTEMASDGTCSSSSQSYSGSLAPLNEEISFHFRGPMNLYYFAAYYPSSSSKKRSTQTSAHARRHAHAHAHGHQHHARDAAVGDIVTATIDGAVVSWTNSYSGVAATSSAASSAAATSATTSATEAAATYSASISVVQKQVAASSSSSAAASSSTYSSSNSTSSGGWTLSAYYDAASGTSDGLVFLNHMGGDGSGVYDSTYGNSLSYASADGLEGASESTILSDVEIPSSGEVIIFTDTICDDDCGFYRDGTVAYHGFDGATKVFLFEFMMPDSGETAASEYDAVNMPAIWLLNALIPRTLQYGTADCSCWESGCGEFDIFEVLAAGDKRMKSTLHGNVAGGDSDYFARPETSSQKAILVLDGDNIQISLLDSSVDLDTLVTDDYISDLLSSTLTQSDTVSLFAVDG